MHIEKKQQDFATKPIHVLYHGCSCCCCCLMWIGGLIGAGLGAAATSQHLMVFRDDPDKNALLRFARYWYWSGLLFLSPLIFLLLYIPNRTRDITDLLWAMIIPAFNFFLAALVTSVAMFYKIPDAEIRRRINIRNWAIFFRRVNWECARRYGNI